MDMFAASRSATLPAILIIGIGTGLLSVTPGAAGKPPFETRTLRWLEDPLESGILTLGRLLAVHHADHGSYPKQLTALNNPAYLGRLELSAVFAGPEVSFYDHSPLRHHAYVLGDEAQSYSFRAFGPDEQPGTADDVVLTHANFVDTANAYFAAAVEDRPGTPYYRLVGFDVQIVLPPMLAALLNDRHSGWSFPPAQDYFDRVLSTWGITDARTALTLPYACAGDFDGDGSTDVATLLVINDTKTLRAFQQRQPGQYHETVVERSSEADDLSCSPPKKVPLYSQPPFHAIETDSFGYTTYPELSGRTFYWNGDSYSHLDSGD